MQRRMGLAPLINFGGASLNKEMNMSDDRLKELEQDTKNILSALIVMYVYDRMDQSIHDDEICNSEIAEVKKTMNHYRKKFCM